VNRRSGHGAKSNARWPPGTTGEGAMGGTFNSKGRGYAWKRDDVAEQQKAK